jgi:hypothetical protein
MNIHYEVGIPYSCPREQIWTPEEEDHLPSCDFCAHRCDNIFMRVFFTNAPTQNYCTPRCWYEGREVVYHEVNPKKKGNSGREVSRLKDNK